MLTAAVTIKEGPAPSDAERLRRDFVRGTAVSRSSAGCCAIHVASAIDDGRRVRRDAVRSTLKIVQVGLDPLSLGGIELQNVDHASTDSAPNGGPVDIAERVEGDPGKRLRGLAFEAAQPSLGPASTRLGPQAKDDALVGRAPVLRGAVKFPRSVADEAGRYGRSEVIESRVFATATSLAPSGIC